MTVRIIGSMLMVCVAAYSYADIRLVSPEEGGSVDILPEVQCRLMDIPTHAERLAALKEDREKGGDFFKSAEWRRATPLILKWKASGRRRHRGRC